MTDQEMQVQEALLDKTSEMAEILDSANTHLKEMSENITKVTEYDKPRKDLANAFLGMLKGDPGEDGNDGKTPTREELIEIIEPLIPAPIPGQTIDEEKVINKILKQIPPLVEPLIPTVKDGKPGAPGKDGKAPTKKELRELIKSLIPAPIPGKPGQDGTTDSPFEIKKKLESLKNEYRLDASAIKGLDKYIIQISTRPRGGGTSTGSGTVGPGTINEIAYFNSATTVASLPVATYPSLTELSYLKGATSAIQTQLTGKLNLSGGAMTGAVTMFMTAVTGSVLDISNSAAGAAQASPTLNVLRTGSTGSAIRAENRAQSLGGPPPFQASDQSFLYGIGYNSRTSSGFSNFGFWCEGADAFFDTDLANGMTWKMSNTAKMWLSTAGALRVTTTYTSGAPNGGTAGDWKFGIRVAATVALDTTQYLQVDIGGTLYKVGVVT